MDYEIRQVDSTSDELSHYGIVGQRWGIRRWQNKDGSLTPEGRKRYGSLEENLSKWAEKVSSVSKTAKTSIKQWRNEVREKAASEKMKREEQKRKAVEEKEQKKIRAAEEKEQKKRELIERGTPEEVKKNIRLFNDSELGEIQQRFDKELKVREQVEKIINYGRTPKTNGSPNGLTGIVVDNKKLSDAMQFVSNTAKQSESTVNNAIKTYNGIAYAYNALSGTHNPMTIIPTKEERQNNPSGGGS